MPINLKAADITLEELKAIGFELMYENGGEFMDEPIWKKNIPDRRKALWDLHNRLTVLEIEVEKLKKKTPKPKQSPPKRVGPRAGAP